MKVSTLALRNLSRNRKRSLLSLSAIAIAAMTITMVFSVIEGMKQNLKTNSLSYLSGQVRVRHTDYDNYEQLNPMHLTVPDADSLTGRFRSTESVRAVSPRISFPGAVFIGDQRHTIRGIGVDFSQEEAFMNFDAILGKGTLPQEGKNEVLIGYKMSERLDLAIGDSFTVMTSTRTRVTNAFTVTVSGILVFPLENMNTTTMVLPLDRAQRYLWMQDHVSEILLLFDPETSDEEALAITKETIEESGIQDISAKSWLEIGTFASMMEWVELIYFFIAIFFFILGSTVIINTTMMTIYERIREIGTLGAMGMSGKSLVRLFLTEAAYLGLAGSLAGVLLGIALVIPLSHVGIDYGEAMEGMDIGISSIIYPMINVKNTIITFFYSAAVATLTSLIPSRKAAKIKPVEALRSN